VNNTFCSTTNSASKKIASDMGLSVDTVSLILSKYKDIMLKCINDEMPFHINGFGKFYCAYYKKSDKCTFSKDATLYKDKVHRNVHFQISSAIKNRVNGWVHDLGIKNNLDKKEMMRLRIRPEEISKMRRTRILEEQRALGFRSDLLFDDDTLPDSDRHVMKELGNAPTLSDLVERLGTNIQSRP